MKTFRYLCVCLCVTFLSIGFSATTLAEIYTLTGRAKTDGTQLGGITKTLTELTSDDTLIVTASSAQIWFKPTATLNCNINISGFKNGTEKTGKLRVDTANNNINGVVTLLGDTVISSSSSTGANGIQFNNQITGTGSMIYAIGVGSTVKLKNTSTSALNNYTGNTNLGYADQFKEDHGIKVVLGASEQIPDAITSGSAAIGNLVMNAFTATQYGSLNLNGFNETVNGLVSGGTTPGNAVIFNNSTTASVLTVGGNDATASYSGKIGTGGTNLSLEKVGTGTQTLSGANTYTGGTTISGGTLAITNSEALGTGAITLNGGTLSTSGTITLNENVAINANSTIDTANGLTLSGNISGSAVLTKTGAGVLTISGSNTFSGGTTVSAGTLAITNSEALGTGAITLNGGTLSTNANNSISLNENIAINANSSIDTVNGLTLSGSISGNGALTKTGSGTLTLSGANTFNGGMTISEGKVSVATGSNTLGAGALTLNSDATLIITGGDSNKTLNISGTATLNGTLDLSSYLSTWNTGTTYTLMTATSIGSTEGLTISGVDTGWIYTVEGSTIMLKYLEDTIWTWTGSSNTSFNKAENWDKGISPVFGSDVIIHSGTTNTAKVDSDVSVKTVALDVASNLQFTAGKTLTTQSMTISGENQTLDLTGGNLTLTNAPAFNINNSDTANASTLTLSSGTYSNVLSGNTNLTKIEADTLTLSGENTYTGATTISEGTLALDANNAIATSASVTVDNNAAITFGATSQTLQNLSGTGTITGSGALTLVNDTATDSTYSGTITATSLTKTGTGTLTFSGANDYSGGTTISAGTLQADNASALGTGTVTIDQNGTLNWNNTTDLANKISGAGTLKLSQGRSSSYDYGLNLQLQNFTGTIDLCAPDEDDRIRIRWNEGTKTEFNKVSLVKITSGNEFWVSTAEATFNCDWEIAGTGYGAGGDNYHRGALRIDKNTEFKGNVSLAADASIKPRSVNVVATFSGDIDLKAHNLTVQSDYQINSAVITGNILSTGGTGSLINGTGTSSTTMTLRIGDTTAATSATTQTIGVNIQQDNTISPLIFQPGENRNIAVSGIISGSGALTKTNAGTLILSGENTYTGKTTISAGRIIATNASALGTGTVTNNSELEFNLATPGTNEQVISGSGELYKSGAGTLTLSGANTFTGGMTISEGKVSVATGSTSLGNGALTLNSGATLIITGGDSNKTLTIPGAATLNGILDLSRYLTTWETGSNYTLMTANSIDSTTGLTLSGVGTGWGWEQSGTSILLKYSGGTLGWNWTGTTGSFMTAANWENTKTPEATSDVTINNEGGVAQIDSDATVKTVTLGEASNMQFTAGKTLTAQSMTISEDNQTLDLTGGNLTLTNAPAFDIANGDSGNASTLTLSTGTYANVLSGNTNLTKAGTGTLTLSGVNTYTGATTVSEGTLNLDIDNAIASSASVENNAEITFGNTSQTLKALTGTGTITGSGVLTLFNDTNTSYAGIITGTGASVTKTGAGTLILSGVNEYSGGTTISAGTLAITNSEALGTGAITLDGGTLSTSGTITLNENIAINADSTIDTAGGLSLSGNISGSAALTKTGTGVLTISGSNTFSGGTTVSAGTLVITNSEALGTGEIKLNGGTLSTSGTIDLDENVVINANSTIDTVNGLTLSGSIFGSAALTKTGAGTLTLSGSEGTYSGTTTVSAGKLSITNSGAISESAKIIIESGAEIESNAIQTIHNLNGSGTYTAGGDLTINSTLNDNVFYGTIAAGTNNVIFTGDGKQKMSFGPSPTDGSLTATLVKLQSGRLDIKGLMNAGLEITGGVFSPGNSVGSLTANSFTLDGGTALFEFDKTIGTNGAWDTLSIATGGSITLTSGVFSLYFDDYNYWHKVGEEYQLISGTTGYTTDTDLTNWLASAYQSAWSLTGKTGGIYLSAKDTPVTPVPEPSTWALLILGALGLMYFRRK